MDAATRQFVRDRANNACEYCCIAQAAIPFISLHVEHIVAQQHVVDSSPENLALACDRCNAFKGPNLTTIDLESGEIIPLFHPRLDEWSQHFAIEDGHIVGKTPTGRATSRLLNMNDIRRVELRQAWIEENRNRP